MKFKFIYIGIIACIICFAVTIYGGITFRFTGYSIIGIFNGLYSLGITYLMDDIGCGKLQ